MHLVKSCCCACATESTLLAVKQIAAWNREHRGEIHPKTCHFLLRSIRAEQASSVVCVNTYLDRCTHLYGLTPADVNCAHLLLQYVSDAGELGVTLPQVKVGECYFI